MTQSNTDEERQFFDAIANSDADTVRSMVNGNRALLLAFDSNSFGATPASRAAFAGNLEMTRTLIELNADLDRRSDWDMGAWSPLHAAVAGGHLDVAKALIDARATLDAHGAAGLSMVTELRELLQRNPSVASELGGDGCQPLHFAGSTEVAQLLIDAGAQLDAKCIDHQSTPVQYLASTNPRVAHFLFEKGATPDIFSAVMSGAEKIVRQMIKENPGVLDERISPERFPPSGEDDVHNILTFTVGGGCGPIHAAARSNQAMMVPILVEAGQSPDLRGGYDDQTPLHSAAWHDLVEVAEALLDAGADIDILSGDIHNNSPAGWAIVAGSANVFEFLMDRGAAKLDWFQESAEAAVKGDFLQYKCVPQENYERILRRLSA